MRERYRIVVCRGPECGDVRGSAEVHAALARAILGRGLGAQVELAWQSCFGQCRKGPNVMVCRVVDGAPASLLVPIPLGGGAAVLYGGVAPADADRIIEAHAIHGLILHDLIRGEERSG